MGLFSRKPKRVVVRVSFRELTAPEPTDYSRIRGYAYLWTLDTPPALNDRVMVRGGDGRLTSATVTALDGGDYRGQLASVARLATEDDYRREARRNDR